MQSSCSTPSGRSLFPCPPFDDHVRSSVASRSCTSLAARLTAVSFAGTAGSVTAVAGLACFAGPSPFGVSSSESLCSPDLSISRAFRVAAPFPERCGVAVRRVSRRIVRSAMIRVSRDPFGISSRGRSCSPCDDHDRSKLATSMLEPTSLALASRRSRSSRFAHLPGARAVPHAFTFRQPPAYRLAHLAVLELAHGLFTLQCEVRSASMFASVLVSAFVLAHLSEIEPIHVHAHSSSGTPVLPARATHPCSPREGSRSCFMRSHLSMLAHVPRTCSPRSVHVRARLHDPPFDLSCMRGTRLCSPIFAFTKRSHLSMRTRRVRRVLQDMLAFRRSHPVPRAGSRSSRTPFDARASVLCNLKPPFDSSEPQLAVSVSTKHARLSTLTSVFAAGCPRP
jgi:hypothetical protein